jgi:hypothetical protein
VTTYQPLDLLSVSPLTFRNVVLALLAYGMAMAGLALWVPEDPFHWLFSEQGPFEILSIGFWLLLAASCFALPGLPRRPLLAPGLAALLAAAREADLHKAFTVESIFKSHYYLRSPAPPGEKLVAGIVALAVLSLVAHVLIAGMRQLRRQHALRFEWGRTLLLGVVLVFACKALDREQSVLGDWFGIGFPPLLRRLNAAFEEGYECLLPVLFLVALVQVQYRRLVGGGVLQRAGSGAPWQQCRG